MKKKLFILMFIACTCQVLAQEPIQDVITVEMAPVLMDMQQNSVKTAAPKKHWSFNIFKRKPKLKKIESGKDVKVAEPDKKTMKDIDKAQKKTLNKAKKEAKKKSKKESKKNMVTTPISEKYMTPAVNKDNETKVLENTAYKGSVNTNKIIEVDECVRLALENHPAIHAAMGNAEIYKSKIAQAWSNYFPKLSAGLSYSRNDMLVTTFSMPIQRYDLYYVPTLSANMLLFDFGKTKSQADIAKRSYEAAKFSLENSINTVIYNVKQSYFNLLFALQQVHVYEDTVHDYELHLEQANAYYNIGKKAKIDVLTAEYNLGKARLNLIQAKNTLKIAYVELSNAMGMPDFTDYDVVDNLATKAYDITIDKAVNTAYETSPELLAAKKKADASEILIKASKRAFTPDISGFASYQRGGRTIKNDDGYQIGAQLTYQNINFLLVKKQMDEAKATHKKDYADYQNKKQNIHLAVKQAYLNMVTAQESITVAKLSMEQAKEQYDMAAGRYKVGLGDAIELKDAETTFRNAQLDYYNTLLKYHVSAANLERLMGVPMDKSNTDLL